MDLLKSKPEKAINSLIKHLQLLETDPEKAKVKLTTDIQTIHKLLYGDHDVDAKKSDIDYIVPRLCESDNDLFKKLGENLKSYDFESKKKTAEIMNYIVRRTGKEENPFAKYLSKNKKIVTDLLKGYHDPNLSQNVGSVLQEMCKRSELAKLLLNEISIKIHNYNDWDTVIKSNQEPPPQVQQQGSQQAQQEAPKSQADKPQAQGDQAQAAQGQGQQGGDQGDAAVGSGPAMPDWNRERTAPEAAQNGDANGNGGQAQAQGQGQAAPAQDKGDEKKQAANEEKEEKKDCNDMVDELFILVQNPSFDIASDAYKTLQLLLTRHKKEVSKYLDKNYKLFFIKFNYLIMSENYVTKRQFLKLLSELLLDKHNFKTMLKYISEKDNLVNAMKLIKNPSKAIAFEAFHIFKVFVANPNKARDVHIVLYKNQQKLITFLKEFLKDKEDQSFISEKEIVIQHLTNMEMPEEIRKKLEERQKTEAAQKEQEAQANGNDSNNNNDNNTNDTNKDNNNNSNNEVVNNNEAANNNGNGDAAS